VLDEEDEVVVKKVVVELEDVEVLEDIVVDEPGDVEVVEEIDEAVVEDSCVLDELEDDVVKIDVDELDEGIVDDHTVLDEEVVVRRVEEELDELEEVDKLETNVAVLISEDSELEPVLHTTFQGHAPKPTSGTLKTDNVLFLTPSLVARTVPLSNRLQSYEDSDPTTL
jgi:hypothetical protein